MRSRRDLGKMAATALLGFAAQRSGFAALAGGLPDARTEPLAASPSSPQALVFPSGQRVATAAMWAARRKEILRTASQQMYGTTPSPKGLRFEIQEAFCRVGTCRAYSCFRKSTAQGSRSRSMVNVPSFAAVR
jgi:hypothetical protein